MIDNLIVSYVHDRDVSVKLSVGTGYDDNLPHNLAALFARVMRDSRVNTDLVMESLANEINSGD